MNEDSLKALKKYLKPNLYLVILMGLISVFAFFIALIGDSSDKGISDTFIFIGIVFLLFAVTFIVITVVKSKNTEKSIKDIEEKGGLQILINDFETGGRAFKDSLILGQTFMLGKKMGHIVDYREIRQVYQYIHKTNFVEDKRTLVVVCGEKSEVIDICRLPLFGKADDEVMQVIQYMISKNPNIKVGSK